MSRPRTIAAVALAAGTFGGTVGALATAAVQSQASSRAAAASRYVITSINQIKPSVRKALATSDVSLAYGHEVIVQPNSIGTSVAQCPAGNVLLSGFGGDPGPKEAVVSEVWGYTSGDRAATGWRITVANYGTSADDVSAGAVCAG